jgi:succinate dehydrogenase / fumarate reductase cytochrome b subunit
MAQASRPVSPHLQIYRWYFTMVLSVAHRATGIALSAGLILLTWWLVAIANGPESYATVRAAMDNILGGLVLFGLTFTLWLHTALGVRHLAWDFGYGYDKNVAHQTGIAAVVAAAGLTILTWIAILVVG